MLAVLTKGLASSSSKMDKRCIILVIDRYNTELVIVLHPNFAAMDTVIKRSCLSLLITSGLLLGTPAWSQTEKETGELPASKPLPSVDQLDDEQAQAIVDAAMAERDSGEVFSAIEKFEYILNRRPSLNRARLELAVSYHRASQYDKALREFQAVLDNPDTPEKVRLAILAYLGQLTSDELKPKTEHSFSYYTKVGALYNSNINYAPLDGYDRLIGNKEIIIPDNQDQDSTGLETFLSASHRYRDNTPLDFGGVATLFEWQSQVSWTGNNYARTSDFNINTLSASTGPALFATGRWRGALNFQIDQTWFGTSTLGTFLSVNPLLTFELGNYRGLTLEACRIPETQVIAGLDSGEMLSRLRLWENQIMMGASLGALKTAFESARDFAKTHKTGGKPAIAYQAVAFKLSEMMTLYQTAQLLAYRAAWTCDARPKEAESLTWCAKVFCTEASEKVASDAMQIMSGEGFLAGNPAERAYRNAKLGQICGTSSEIARVKIGDHALGYK